MVRIKRANIWVFYFRRGFASQPTNPAAEGGGGRFVTYSRGGEFNSFRYKYISSGWAEPGNYLCEHNGKNTENRRGNNDGRGFGLNFVPRRELNYEKSVRYFEPAPAPGGH